MAVNKYTKVVLDNIDVISEKLNDNIFIKEARKAFKDNIKDFELADDEKSKLIAQYEAQVSIGIVAEILKLAKDLPTDEKNIANIEAQTNLLKQQGKVEKEKEKLFKEQVCSEKAKTKLIIEQIVSEMYRHKDLRASIGIKVTTNEVSKQQAKFEEARRHIALVSNNQNTFMKKADYYVQQLQAIVQDERLIVSEKQIEETKRAIDRIPTETINYTSEVRAANLQISDETISSKDIGCDE